MPILFHAADRPTTIHSREGLGAYLDHKVTRPDMHSDTAYASLADAARTQYDRDRILHASGGIVISTPHVLEASRLLEQAFAINVGRNSGHAGLMLDGDSTVGKTETAKALMRMVHSQYKRMCPEYADLGQIPVVYISVPAVSTGKLLMKTFAEFLGLPVTGRESMGEIRGRVVQALIAAGTQLIVVDELQNLGMGRSVGMGESVDVLKGLHNELPATFVYAGIGLATGKLLSGERGRQLRGRFTILKMDRLNLSDAADRKTWNQLIAAFEKQLPLRHQDAGTLKKLSSYLYLRTSGSVGSLAKLLSLSTIELIRNPKHTDERLTEAVMDTIKLDEFAEENYKVKKASLRPKADQYPMSGLEAA